MRDLSRLPLAFILIVGFFLYFGLFSIQEAKLVSILAIIYLEVDMIQALLDNKK